MGLSLTVRELLGYPKRIAAYRSLQTAQIIQRNLPTVTHPLRPGAGGQITCDALDITFDPLKHEHLLSEMPRLTRLVQSGAGRISIENGEPIFATGSIRVPLPSSESIELAEEVFYKGVYDFTPQRDCLVLDIGMNAGLASLFFAGVKGWEVVAYEPFPETYATARKNIESSGLADRIETHEEALSDRSEAIVVSFDANWTGRNSVLFDEVYGEKMERTSKIQLVDAAPVIKALKCRAGDRLLVVKMDCEGSEFAILDRLSSEALLGQIDVLVLEFHPFVPGRDATSLEKLLLDAGFFVRLPHARAREVAMMWAVKAS